MLSTIHIIWTILLLAAFIAIAGWAFSARQREHFDRAARSVLDEDGQEGRHG